MISVVGTYIIKLYDLELVSFRVQTNAYGQIQYTDIEINNKYKALLPPAFEEWGLSKWLEARIIPKNREFVNEILRTLGNPYHAMEIIKISLGLSVTDSYWVVEEDFSGTFKDYNLFENEFSKALALVAFTGYNTKITGIVTSPELTTNGMLRKCWRRINGKLYLYKGGTSGAANTGLEPYSEFYASQIAERMGIKAVYYDLKKFKGQIVSVCEAFTDIDTSFVPIGLLVKSKDIKEISNTYGVPSFADMVLFDAIICNTDRHMGNYGLLRDNKTSKYIGPSPIFDHGLSLFNYAMKDDFDKLEEYAKTRLNAFDADPVVLAKSVMSLEQRQKLRRLIDFTFSRHKNYNLPEWRLKAIERFIQNRVQELLR